ncbi:MAG: DNA polymerase IV [Dehalococcoidia bacterium]
MPQRTILHVDIDCFFAAAEVARRPELRGRPVIVGKEPGYRGVVCAASYEARDYGVRTAMPLAQAQRLCPHAVFLPTDIHHYAALSRRFHAILARYTPDVEPLGLDEAFLDLTGCEPIVGDAVAAAHDVRRCVREELSLTCSAGLATAKVVAKVASEQAKPDGFLAVPPGGEAAFLAPLPLRRLPMVGAQTEKALLGLGLTTIGDVARLPGSTREARFGALGRLIWYHAHGLDAAPVQAPAATKSVSREVTFPHDVNDPQLLRATVRLGAERIGAELRGIGRRARSVSLKLRYGDFTTIGRSATLTVPTNADQVIYEAACRLLARALAQERRAVRLIGVGTAGLVSDAQLPLPEADGGPRSARGGSSGWSSSSERWESLARWIDRLRAKYGFRVIQTGRTGFCPTLERLYLR